MCTKLVLHRPPRCKTPRHFCLIVVVRVRLSLLFHAVVCTGSQGQFHAVVCTGSQGQDKIKLNFRLKMRSVYFCDRKFGCARTINSCCVCLRAVNSGEIFL